MVNYLYDLRFIEANHEAFANHGTVVASPAVQQALRETSRKSAPEPRHV
jgi:malonyl-CoA decarboxylase